MSVLRWDPFQDLLSLQEEMNRVFDRFAYRTGNTTGQPTPTWAPPMDIVERKDAYLVAVDLPGVHPDDIEVTLENNLLTIQGQRHRGEDSAEQRLHRVERLSGGFRRSVTLPTTVKSDAIQAIFTDGVLELLVPKADEAKPKKISIAAGDQRHAVTAR
jgi:HSP20 family protein